MIIFQKTINKIVYNSIRIKFHRRYKTENRREQWRTKLGFIFAAVGSAVGLGNIWRFPYEVYSNGGGAFLIPYFVAIFTAGIPILILEYSMGHKYRGSTPLALARANKKWEWLGWWPTVTAFAILTYYSTIISWAINYFSFSFTSPWGNDANNFFHNDFLNITSSPLELGGIVLKPLIGVLIVWGITGLICYKGIKSGIEKVNRILLPSLVIIMIIIVIKGITLEGASLGLNTLFNPDWSQVKNPKIWVAAYGQVFYSMSIAMGIMMTYSSYLPKKTDINNSAFMVGLANCSFEFLAAIGVFSILGFMAASQGVAVNEVVSSGIGLAFVVFPEVFSTMGSWGTVLGSIFFLCLIFAGITSLVSLIEACSSAIIDKLGVKREKIVLLICIAGCIGSSIFVTEAGLYILDIVDEFVNSYGIAVVGLIEALVIGWIIKAENLRNHANSVSYFKIGRWWDFCIKYLTPSILMVMLIQSLVTEVKTPYGGYPLSALMLYGRSVIGAGIILGLVIAKKPWRKELSLNINENQEVI